jgi:hypothetical protein
MTTVARYERKDAHKKLKKWTTSFQSPWEAIGTQRRTFGPHAPDVTTDATLSTAQRRLERGRPHYEPIFSHRALFPPRRRPWVYILWISQRN